MLNTLIDLINERFSYKILFYEYNKTGWSIYAKYKTIGKTLIYHNKDINHIKSFLAGVDYGIMLHIVEDPKE